MRRVDELLDDSLAVGLEGARDDNEPSKRDLVLNFLTGQFLDRPKSNIAHDE